MDVPFVTNVLFFLNDFCKTEVIEFVFFVVPQNLDCNFSQQSGSNTISPIAIGSQVIMFANSNR